MGGRAIWWAVAATEEETIVEQLERVRQSDPRKQFIFIGHDLGCFVLAEVAKACPAGSVLGQVFISGFELRQFAARVSWPSQWLKSFYVVLLQLSGVAFLARTLAVLPGGHWLNRENPAHVNPVVGSFSGWRGRWAPGTSSHALHHRHPDTTRCST